MSMLTVPKTLSGTVTPVIMNSVRVSNRNMASNTTVTDIVLPVCDCSIMSIVKIPAQIPMNRSINELVYARPSVSPIDKTHVLIASNE